jgi:hypothetical protein
VPGRDVMSDRVVIAVDPHKASWTAAVVNASLQQVALLRVPVSAAGYRALRRFAGRWPQASWAIEGAGGLGAPLASRLSGDGIAGGRRAGQARCAGPGAVQWTRPQDRRR